jgi:hypothetical protein
MVVIPLVMTWWKEYDIVKRTWWKDVKDLHIQGKISAPFDIQSVIDKHIINKLFFTVFLSRMCCR